jgi:hypothetical protein
MHSARDGSGYVATVQMQKNEIEPTIPPTNRPDAGLRGLDHCTCPPDPTRLLPARVRLLRGLLDDKEESQRLTEVQPLLVTVR